MDQRSRARSAVQGAVSQGLGAELNGRDREIPGPRHDSGHRVEAFGEKVFDVIEAAPDRLREVTGIGAVRAKRITDAWAEEKIVREIMVFLHSHGVGTAWAVRIFKTYGADSLQVMTENPIGLPGIFAASVSRAPMRLP
jgi:ATP-dependent exoDNAse (exonuclease V) alpha subunit